MPIPRPILLALAGALLAIVAFYATMGARSSGEGSREPGTPATKREPAEPKKATGRTAKGATAADRPGAASARAARTKAARKPSAAARPGLPAEVARALARGQTVILFFFQRGGADDEATARAVSAVRGRRGAKVFSAPISRLADYRAVTAGAGVSQAPAVVILRRGGSARLVEGFVDPETLIQQVADTR